jgi:hypothetical protein
VLDELVGDLVANDEGAVPEDRLAELARHIDPAVGLDLAVLDAAGEDSVIAALRHWMTPSRDARASSGSCGLAPTIAGAKRDGRRVGFEPGPVARPRTRARRRRVPAPRYETPLLL